MDLCRRSKLIEKKKKLINLGVKAEALAKDDEKSSELPSWAIGVIAAVCVLALVAVIAAVIVVSFPHTNRH